VSRLLALSSSSPWPSALSAEHSCVWPSTRRLPPLLPHKRAHGKAAHPSDPLWRAHVSLREDHRRDRDGARHVVGNLPVARKAARTVTLALGTAWVLLMSGSGRRTLSHPTRRRRVPLAVRRRRHCRRRGLRAGCVPLRPQGCGRGKTRGDLPTQVMRYVRCRLPAAADGLRSVAHA